MDNKLFLILKKNGWIRITVDNLFNELKNLIKIL